jgi:hypothetical protein
MTARVTYQSRDGVIDSNEITASSFEEASLQAIVWAEGKRCKIIKVEIRD